DETFALLKSNVKVTKERIPAATQLFTPDWIVRYMVENSLGRLWVEGHPDDSLKAGWKYYLEEAEQEPDVQKQLDEIRKEYAELRPEDIKIIDPCMGSGHILVYAFDVLMQIYESSGYTQRDAAVSILENNLYGLDIDERAAQLAYFAVMMKARQYNRRILNDYVTCNVYAIRESNGIDRDALNLLGEAKNIGEKLVDTFIDAKEYGSILNVDITADQLALIDSKIDELKNKTSFSDVFEAANSDVIFENVVPLLLQAKLMVQKYDAVITNPPYRAVADCTDKLNSYAKKKYPDSKNDLATICMEKTLYMCADKGYMAMINIPVWMFLSSFECLRNKILSKNTMINMLHFGRGVFGSDFGTTAFVFRKKMTHDYVGVYRRLFEKQGAVDSIEVKERWFFEGKGKYLAKQEGYMSITGSPVAYWAGDKVLEAFRDGTPMGIISPPKQGSTVGNNDKFLRLWFETLQNKKKWFPCLKGGPFQKWYGNHNYVLNWENDGADIIAGGRQTIRNSNMLFKKGISWTRVTIGASSFRIMLKGYFFESASGVCFPTTKTNYILGLLNSKIVQAFAEMLNPTATLQSGDLARIPVVIDENMVEVVEKAVDESIEIAEHDWDSFETSWDFKKHPLI
ncbi:MAG: BREX-1 system adenine-specific DNA-methyltransferase PglX, partial [Treponema sp.]|nr:BREX-1 system adenine-specific DNA-methyltransferase PglX [Treponema sp.]